MIDIVFVIILGVLGSIAGVMGICSTVNEARLMEANKRLRRRNNEQRLELDRLRTEVFFKESA